MGPILPVSVLIVSVAFLHFSKAELPTACNNKGDCPVNSNCNTDCVCDVGYKLNTGKDGCIQKVIGDTCTADTDCKVVDNSKCKTEETRTCICADAYKHQESDDTCIAKVIGDTCTENTDCKEVDNSKCKTDAPRTCICADTYKHQQSDDTCIAKVIGNTCAADTDCEAVDNSLCKTDAPRTCVCADAYEHQESDDTCIAKAVNEIQCTADGGGCEKIENALCDAESEKCQCSPNFVMNVNTCESNIAASIRIGVTTVVLSVFAAIWTMFR